MIHLDTSFLIHALVAGSSPDAALRRWITDAKVLAMSSIAWAEFLCGPVQPEHAGLASQVVAECVPFLEEDAAAAAHLFNTTGRRRGTMADCMIAAVALRQGAEIATTNPDDFLRFTEQGLVLASFV